MIISIFHAATVALAVAATAVASDKLVSRAATDHPLDLYGRHPSAEAIIANSSQALDYMHPSFSNHTRFLPKEQKVLAYVTPWNQPRGRENAEYYRGKLDFVSPVWYTVKPVPKDQQRQDAAFEETAATGNEYAIEGGPPSEEDKEWLKRLRSSAKTPAGEELPPLKVTPRVQLDRWTESDFQTLRSDPLRWMTLAMKVLNTMSEGPYDGMVFESAASWMIPEVVEHLGSLFKQHNLTLIVVFQPLKPTSEGPEANAKLAEAIRRLADKVDYVHIMTYDWGPSGVPVDFDKLDLAPENPLRQEPEVDRMRSLAPNQPVQFLRNNIESLAAPGGSLDEMPADSFGGQTPMFDVSKDSSFSHKFLMGLPMYGYTFPIMWLDKKTAAGLPRVPTASPPKARANLTDAQESQRGVGYRKDARKFPLLRKAGIPLTHSELLGRMLASRPLIYLDDESNEMRFDYVAPNEDDDGSGPEGMKEGIYYRAFMPSAYTMITRREMLEEGGVGAALWDIGQAAPWLLHAL